MHTSPRLVLASLSLLVALPTAAHADRVIDAFLDPLPSTTLPGATVSGPHIWAGRLGTSTQLESTASQSNVPRAVGGRRVAKVREATLSNSVIATLTAGSGRLSYATGPGPAGGLTLEYGATADLNLNLIADGGLAFELTINGDMDNSSPVRPVQLTITARSGGGAAVSRTFPLAADGVYQLPFSAFTGVSFADVDYLKFHFDASAVQAIDFDLIGGLRTSGCIPASGPALADHVIDSFRNDLPLRSIPGAGTAPIMWAGTINGTSKASDYAEQSGLDGTIGGQRTTTIDTSAIQNFLTANTLGLVPTPVLSYSTGYPTSGTLILEYGTLADLNANLSAMKAFELEIDSDLTSGPRPVPLTVTVASGNMTQSTTITLLHDKTYYIPFTAFPGVNFADIDVIAFEIDASLVQAVDIDLVGGLRASACVR